MGTCLAIGSPFARAISTLRFRAVSRPTPGGEMRDMMPQDSDSASPDAPETPTAPGTLGSDVPTPMSDPGIFTEPELPAPTTPQTAPEVPNAPEFPGVTDPESSPPPPAPEMPDAPARPGEPEIPDPIIPQTPEEPIVP